MQDKLHAKNLGLEADKIEHYRQNIPLIFANKSFPDALKM